MESDICHLIIYLTPLNWTFCYINSHILPLQCSIGNSLNDYGTSMRYSKAETDYSYSRHYGNSGTSLLRNVESWSSF